MLKMEENKQHFWCIMLYYFKKGENVTEMQKKICAVFMKCVKSGLWKLHAGDFSLGDAPWSCRPIKVDSSQINILIDND